jgi:hypothetical protein
LGLDLLNTEADVTALLGQGPLIEAVAEIMAADRKYEERKAAFRFVAKVVDKAAEELRRSIVKAGFLQFIALFVGDVESKVQLGVLQCIAITRERDPECELMDELVAALEQLAVSEERTTAEVATAILEAV